MNTSRLKPFAQQARILFREGVDARLQYWGFSSRGQCTEQVEPVSGGYIFRGQIFNDPALPAKWNKLRDRIRDKQSYDDLVEEAAYTWFNRLMAIRILEKNNHEAPVLAYTDEQTRLPRLLQNARRGQLRPAKESDGALLQEYLLEDKDQEAMALLLVDHCNRHDLLRQLFGRIDDYTELLLPGNLLRREGILDHIVLSEAISDEDYREVELIGWLYQFYIADKKDQVFKGFKNKKKARPQDIPAATQIFTPRWIVEYMVQNTLGQTWLEQHPDSPLREGMKYLVEKGDVEKREARWENQESRIESRESRLDSQYPPAATDLSAGEGGWGVNGTSPVTSFHLLDPAAGSGHILVVAFDLLIGMYGEAGYPSRQAAKEILRHNLYGLDLDLRAVQLARFALLLKAAQYDRSVLRGDLMPHIYAMPQPYDFRAADVQSWLGSEGQAYLGELMTALQEMQQAHNIGSALKLELSPQAHHFLAHKLQIPLQPHNPTPHTPHPTTHNTQYPPVRSGIGAGEGDLGGDLLQSAAGEQLHRYLPIVLLLTARYPAVVANPPYMGGGNMNGELKAYLGKHFKISKSDLMTVFMEVIEEKTESGGRFALINLPSWLFLSSFEKLREQLLSGSTIESLLHMGRGIFGIDFGSVAFAVKKAMAENPTGNYFRLHERVFQHLYYWDIEKIFLNALKDPHYKYDFSLYREGEKGVTPIPEYSVKSGMQIFYPTIPQTQFAKIPGSPIAYWVSERVVKLFSYSPSIKDIAKPRQGMATTNNQLFLRSWFETSITKMGTGYNSEKEALNSNKKWFPVNKGGSFRRWYGNNWHTVNFENAGKAICDYIDNTPGVKVKSNGRVINRQFYFKEGITWSSISSGGFGMRYSPPGFIFETKGSMCFAKNRKTLTSLLGYTNTKLVDKFLLALSPTLDYHEGPFSNVPIAHEPESSIDKIVQNCIPISRLDWDAHETSWDFERSEVRSETSEGSLEANYQRYQDYWQLQFYRLHALEEELNRIFIGIYGLEEELTPEVALSDITILQEELDRGEALSAAEQALREHPLAAKIREKLLGVGESGRLESEDWRMENGEGGKREDGKDGSDEEAFDLDRATEAEKALRPEIIRLAEELDLPALPIRQDLVLQQFLSYCIGVIMGRYRLDRPGLHIAHPGATPEELAPYSVERRDIERREARLDSQTPPVRSDLSAGEGGWGVTKASDSAAEYPPAASDSSAGEGGWGVNNPDDLASSFSQRSGLASRSEAVSHLFSIDDDGIIPMIGSASPFSDDVVRRVTDVIRLIWGEDSLTANLNFLQAGLGMDLEKWLTTKFWDYHKKMYSKRPIYWLFQSPGKSFQVLVYMHRLTRYTMQQIRNQYLHPYQQWLSANLDKLMADEANLTKAQQKELDQTRKALADCRDYDEQLKQLAAQQIEIDLDDGVVVNIEKFGSAIPRL